MDLIILLAIIILLTTLIIGYIAFRQIKRILINQETIMLELNELLVAVKHRDE